MKSSSEIDTVSKRATKASGFSWGIAEEVGKNIKTLELFGIGGIENLNAYLQQLKNHKAEGPKEINKNNSPQGESFCPFYTGVALIDAAEQVSELKTRQLLERCVHMRSVSSTLETMRSIYSQKHEMGLSDSPLKLKILRSPLRADHKWQIHKCV